MRLETLLPLGKIDPGTRAPETPFDIAGCCRAKQWDALPERISDEVLEQFAVIDTYDRIGARLCERFGDCVTDIEFSIAVTNEQDREVLSGLARTIQASPVLKL